MKNIKGEFVNLADSKKNHMKSSQDHAAINPTNQFEIPDSVEIYPLGIRDIIVDDRKINFAYKAKRISVPIPTTEELDDYDCRSTALEKKLMKLEMPYNTINKFTEFFLSYEAETIEKIRQIRKEERI